ncbi:MAG: hypothetical protein O9353_10975, partial [Bacteroidia bacterium]|nr:hypothetical protein [Bacteroidia bacterium]
MIDRLSNAYGRFLAALSLLGCAILLAMMFIIVADVALRNLAIPGLPQGLAWSNEISELCLMAPAQPTSYALSRKALAVA